MSRAAVIPPLPERCDDPRPHYQRLAHQNFLAGYRLFIERPQRRAEWKKNGSDPRAIPFDMAMRIANDMAEDFGDLIVRVGIGTLRAFPLGTLSIKSDPPKHSTKEKTMTKTDENKSSGAKSIERLLAAEAYDDVDVAEELDVATIRANFTAATRWMAKMSPRDVHHGIREATLKKVRECELQVSQLQDGSGDVVEIKVLDKLASDISDAIWQLDAAFEEPVEAAV